METNSRPEQPVTRHPEPTFESSHEETRKIQMMEAQKHNKFNTMEQARLDAIARIMQTENEDALKAQEKMISSVKMDRKPEFDEDENIRKLQESHYKKHTKINTFEQAKLDAIARLAMSQNKWGMKAREVQQYSLSKEQQDGGVKRKPLNAADLKKYDKMQKIGMPEGAIRNKMKIDGIDSEVIDSYFGEAIEHDDAPQLRQTRKEIEQQIKAYYEGKLEIQRSNMADAIKWTEKNLKKKMKKLEKELDEARQAIKELEQSKLSLVLSTS
eukprot:250742_1